MTRQGTGGPYRCTLLSEGECGGRTFVAARHRGLPCVGPFAPSWMLRAELSQTNVFKGRLGGKEREAESVFSDPWMLGDCPDRDGRRKERRRRAVFLQPVRTPLRAGGRGFPGGSRTAAGSPGPSALPLARCGVMVLWEVVTSCVLPLVWAVTEPERKSDSTGSAPSPPPSKGWSVSFALEGGRVL